MKARLHVRASKGRGNDRPEMNMSSRITAALRKLFSSRQGSIAIQVAVGLVAVVGLAGLGTEATFLMFKQRHMQVSADSAVISAVMALGESYPRDPQTEARAVAAGLGFRHGFERATVTVNTPPLTGPYAGNGEAAEVIISQTHDMSMIKLFTNTGVNVGARAVAIQEKGRFCFLALDPTAPQSVYAANNAVIGGNCGVVANSSAEDAVYLNNNAVIDTALMTHGNWFTENGAAVTGSPQIRYGRTIADPYADVEPAPAGGCTGQVSSSNQGGTFNLTPGHFCSGWDFKNSVTLNLAPGTYYIDQQLKIMNNVLIEGTDVTIVVNEDFPIDIKNGAIINIEAPTTGDLAGIAFYSHRDATPSILQKFDNNVTLNIQGAIYFPNQILEVDNNGTTQPVGCTQVIGRQLVIMNNVEMKNDCDDTGVLSISPRALLVE